MSNEESVVRMSGWERAPGTTGDELHPLAWPGVLHWERVFAVAQHATIALVLVPLFPVVGAVVLWLIRRKRSRFVDDHGRQAINFQLTLVVYAGVALLLSGPTCGASAYVGIPCVYILGGVGAVMACNAARRGRVFRYPMTIPMLASAV